eukprot:RCo000202
MGSWRSKPTDLGAPSADAVPQGVEIVPGVKVRTVIPGDGKNAPARGSMVTVHYTGTLANGKMFDSSRVRGQPFTFQLGTGKVIKCWDLAVKELTLGQRAVVTCAPEFAYGSRGVPPTIPPNAVLNFDVELLKFL